ncbi:MAG: DUF4340 domain-containing protein [Myxococcota bacterium]
MNRNTIIMVVLALGSAGAAYSMRPQPLPDVQFEDTGEALFPDFTDPTTATQLEIVAWNEDEARVVSFSVSQTEGRWVIPSHNDYPADGTARMGKAAASFIDVKKDRYYGDNPANHGAYGVIDPEATEGEADEKGQRITIKDAADTVLVDIIVGNEIEGRSGYYYVREPGEDSKRVYGSKLELDISTSFEDWIEKDLLGVERDEFHLMIYDPYTVDEVEGRVTGFQPVAAKVIDPANRREWALLEGIEVPEGKVLDSTKLRQVLTAMANLKIVGVRPRPQVQGLLQQQIARQDMARKGFFVATGPSGEQAIFGNEGKLSAATDDGVEYTLYFGEVTYETGIDLTAGAPTGSPDDDKGVVEEGVEEQGKDEEADDKKVASRYMFVDVGYNPAMDTRLAGLTDPAGEGEGASEPIDAEGDKAKMAESQEKAGKLQARFNQWFYVISDSSFTQMHKERDELFKDAPADAGGAAPAGAPGGAPPVIPGL